METLKDKVAIVTGASSGIGRAIAIYFAKYMAKLVLVGRNEKSLDETIQLCKGQSSDNMIRVVCDLCTKEGRQLVVDKTIEKFGRVNILVNNAGIYRQNRFENVSEAEFDETMESNLKQVVFLTQMCMPHLISTKGCVVNVSSVCSSRAYAEQMVYCVSKAALDHFTRCLALGGCEMAPKKVRVNSVNPGGVVTNLYKGTSFCPTEEEEKKLWDWEAGLHPLQRNGHVEEIASAVAYLACDQASFVTGETFFVDGGRQLV